MKRSLFIKTYEDGQALVFVMLMLFIITYIIMAVLVRRTEDITVTHGQTNSTEALALADSGLSDMETLIGSRGPLSTKPQPFSSSCEISLTTGTKCDGGTITYPNSLNTVCSVYNATYCAYDVKAISLTTGDYYGTIFPISLKVNGGSCASATNTCNINVTVTYASGTSGGNTLFVSFGDDAGDTFPSTFAVLNGGSAIIKVPAGTSNSSIYPTEAQITTYNLATVQVSVN